MKIGSKAKVVGVIELSLGNYDLRFRMFNNEMDFVIHTKGEVKNGRLVKGRAVKNEDSESLLEAQYHLLDN